MRDGGLHLFIVMKIHFNRIELQVYYVFMYFFFAFKMTVDIDMFFHVI